ncbi:MAG: cupin domain-containing protein [Myxococcota bacterium]
MTLKVQIVTSPDPASAGPDREAKALAEVDGLKLVAITLRRGTELADHVAPGPISVQVAAGRATLLAGGETYELGPGEVALLAAGVHHAVRPIGTAPVVVLLNRCSTPGGVS